MGCYPLFLCRDWTQLGADLDDLDPSLVSLALVTDPFGGCTERDLRDCFKDVVIPFKPHYVVDLQRPLNEIGRPRRRKQADRALRDLEVGVTDNPAQFLDTWVALYGNLVTRHQITDLRVFSRTAFAAQLGVRGTVILHAAHEGRIIAAQIYYVHGDVVYCHLGAASDAAYELSATAALDWFSVKHFAGRARWLDLGGGAGLEVQNEDGLTRYKRRWSTETRPTYFCGRILNQERYARLASDRGGSDTGYFPAYRVGEFSG